MASTYTANLGIEKPGSGEQSGTWGTTTNTNFDIIDRAINGVVALTLTGTTTTLTTSDGALSDGGYRVLVLSGSPSGTNTITISPNDQDKLYLVHNNTNQSAIFSQGSGANATVPAGDFAWVFADGAGAAAAVTLVTVDTSQLADSSITSAKIVDGTIATADIADDAVTSAKIADATIVAGNIATDTITATQIAADAVGSSELANNAVDTAAIADDAVTSAKIADATIVAGNLADGAVTSAKILDGTIATADIADDAVTSAKIADATIVAGNIANNTITATQIAADAVGSSELADNAVDTAAIASTAVTTAKIANDAVTQAKIADDAVGADQLASNAVVNASVASGAAIAFSKMANLTTSRALVSDGNGDVSVSAVTSTEIGYLDGVTSNVQTQINNIVVYPQVITVLTSGSSYSIPSGAQAILIRASGGGGGGSVWRFSGNAAANGVAGSDTTVSNSTLSISVTAKGGNRGIVATSGLSDFLTGDSGGDVQEGSGAAGGSSYKDNFDVDMGDGRPANLVTKYVTGSNVGGETLTISIGAGGAGGSAGGATAATGASGYVEIWVW